MSGTLPDALITRCAWCDSYEVGAQWLSKDEVAAFLRDDGSSVTHGICPRCLDELQEHNLSVGSARRMERRGRDSNPRSA
jgi:hypothetical protein